MKNRKLLVVIIIVFLGFFWKVSCNNEKNEQKDEVISTQEDVFKPGSFQYKIECRSDQSQHYAAYLPRSYNTQNTFPIIMVFDAHARGKMAVHKFKQTADEFGYIIVASNNAKNGLTTLNNTINALFDDVFYRFKIDKNRVYTAGFSGGGRVASSIAIYKGGVSGVMAIAGGLPKVSQEVSHKFDFVGIVGDEDFNFLEMRTLDKQMAELSFPHILLVSDKGHEWPDGEMLKSGFQWFEIQAMKRSIIPVNDNLVRNYSQLMADSINKLVLTGNVYKAKLLYEQFLSLLEGFYDISDYQKSYQVLLKNPNAKIQENKMESSVKTEAERQQYYIDLFKKQSFKQLTKSFIELRSSTNSEDVQSIKQARRLINYMSMLAYLFTNSAFQSNDLVLTKKYLDLYEYLDPKNPDVYYFKACLLANNNNEKGAVENLNKAMSLGFFDVSRIESEKHFVKISALSEWQEILAKAKINLEK